MARYRIYRLREARRQAFRDTPPAPGPLQLKKRDYEPGEEIEADSPYAAWQKWREQSRPIAVGDALETESGALFVCKFVGFEEARWYVPETPATAAATPEGTPAPVQ